MNFIQIARRVKRESGRSGSGPATAVGATGDDLRILDWCADAWNDIQGLPYNWNWMWDTAVVSLPAQVSHTTSSLSLTRFGRFRAESDDYAMTAYDPANSANEWKLFFLPWERFRARFVVGTHAAAEPQYWSVKPDGSLAVGPTPTAVRSYRFDYWKSPQTLTLDADTPEMPTDYHMAVVWRALMSCAVNDAASEIYQRAYSSYDEIEGRLIADQGEQIRITARAL